MPSEWEDRTRLKMQIAVSAIVLAASLAVIFAPFPDAYTKWAFGMVGLVVGYWLR